MAIECVNHGLETVKYAVRKMPGRKSIKSKFYVASGTDQDTEVSEDCHTHTLHFSFCVCKVNVIGLLHNHWSQLMQYSYG